ncbi:Hypothetical predicted protein [Paramuricea clavata]|uniref:Uncharacterized protein n=1 Tax=Paramuricea clavata TaxID=317549 RepID=A0A7D9DVT2_PARCT|nr:Hypothetical predicted protein [Paramuricea clavata]
MNHGEIAEAQSSTSAVGATQNAAVTIINRHLNIGSFQLTRDSNDTAVRWAKWKQNIERQFRIFGIEERRENSQYQRRDNKSERRETKSRQYSKPDDQSNYN